MIEAISGVLAAVAIWVAIILVARRATTFGRAVVHGLLTGLLGSLVLGLIGGFLSVVLPLGQMNFYLATKLHNAGILDLWPQFTVHFGRR
jgi:hypothetical protein